MTRRTVAVVFGATTAAATFVAAAVVLTASTEPRRLAVRSVEPIEDVPETAAPPIPERLIPIPFDNARVDGPFVVFLVRTNGAQGALLWRVEAPGLRRPTEDRLVLPGTVGDVLVHLPLDPSAACATSDSHTVSVTASSTSQTSASVTATVRFRGTCDRPGFAFDGRVTRFRPGRYVSCLSSCWTVGPKGVESRIFPR